MIIGDEASRTTDRELDYFLAISFGKVKYVILNKCWLVVPWKIFIEIEAEEACWRSCLLQSFVRAWGTHQRARDTDERHPWLSKQVNQAFIGDDKEWNRSGQEEFDKHVY